VSYRVAELVTEMEWIRSENRDLELQDFYQPGPYLHDPGRLIDAARRALDGYTASLSIHGPNPSHTFAPKDPEVGALIESRFAQCLEFCGQLGADMMVMHSPFVGFGRPFTPQRQSTTGTSTFARASQVIANLLPRAEELGCRIVVENVFDTDPWQLIDFVGSFDSEFVRLSIDVGHATVMQRNGGAPPADYWIQAGSELVAHLHLQDGDGWTDRHWQPGTGIIGWPGIATQIAALPASPRLILELDDRDCRQGVRRLVDMGLGS
jgi:sugar phosphate isomerase/epimerase